MTRFWFVRHGPTHVDGLVGWTDVPADLSDTAAISRLNAYLPQNALIISSDLIRCVATANSIEQRRERLEHSDRLRELHFGDWEAMTFSEVEKIDAGQAYKYWTNPGEIAPPNGESWFQAEKRISSKIDELAVSYPDRDIVVVAHFGAILTQVQRVTSMTPKAALAFKVDNLSVTRLEYMDPSWRVLGVNHIP